MIRMLLAWMNDDMRRHDFSPLDWVIGIPLILIVLVLMFVVGIPLEYISNKVTAYKKKQRDLRVEKALLWDEVRKIEHENRIRRET